MKQFLKISINRRPILDESNNVYNLFYTRVKKCYKTFNCCCATFK